MRVTVIRGRARKFGDDVNTDLIQPGKYLELTDPVEMARHAMEGADPEFVKKTKPGDLIVGGRNFGCGSSRENAPIALKYAGIGAVVAESFARIFYRNAINIGLTALECQGISEAVREGDILEVDLSSGVIRNLNSNVALKFAPMPAFMLEIFKAGGLVEYLKSHMDEWMR